MSVVLKKDEAERVAFNYKPKALKFEAGEIVKDFVNISVGSDSEFVIADLVAKQSGVSALRKQQLDAQVEETVLARLKDIEESAYKQAHDLGLIEGAERAYKEQSESLKASQEKLDEAGRNLDSLIANLCKQYEAEIMQMIFRVAERIAMHEITMNKEVVLDVLHKIVDELQAAQHIKVLMNAEDLKFVEELRAKGSKEAEKLARVKIESGENIKRGGCLVETEFGSVEATVEQRVEKAWKAIESKLPVVQSSPSSGWE